MRAPLAADFDFIDLGPDTESFRAAALRGLKAPRKSIPPKFLYDHRGSMLFDSICTLPEYYPTRTETALLRRHGREMAAMIGTGCRLVEFGSGSSDKVRILLDAMESPAAYVPVDISRTQLRQAAATLAQDYPGLSVVAICADYTRPFPLPPGEGRRVGFFPGSTIGNFTPDEAERFLAAAARTLKGGGLLIGVDLQKDPRILHAAYNDSRGVTAAFILNLLERMNRELDADFDIGAFGYLAFYNEAAGRIEIYIESRADQVVTVSGEPISFAAGERLHAEYSHKFTIEGFRELARRSGFVPRAVWVDPDELFSIHYLAAA